MGGLPNTLPKNRNNTDLVNLAAYDWAQFTPHPKHFVNTLKLV